MESSQDDAKAHLAEFSFFDALEAARSARAGFRELGDTDGEIDALRCTVEVGASLNRKT